MKAAPPKQAAKKCCPEKCLSASGTFPVCQPCGHEEVRNKSQRKQKPRNKIRESYLQHCSKEETKHHKPAPPVRGPGIRILRIDPETGGFVGSFRQAGFLSSSDQGLAESLQNQCLVEPIKNSL